MRRYSGLGYSWAVVATTSAFAASDATPKVVRTNRADFSVNPVPTTVNSGRITFVAANRGKVEHELVIVKTTKDASKLGVGAGKASEKGELAEIEDIEPGAGKRLTVTLKPGHYVLLCNIGRHYGAGMYRNFVVR